MNAPGVADVNEWIGVEQHDVSDVSRSDGTERVGDTEESRRTDGRGGERLAWCHVGKSNELRHLIVHCETRDRRWDRRIGAGENLNTERFQSLQISLVRLDHRSPIDRCFEP